MKNLIRLLLFWFLINFNQPTIAQPTKVVTVKKDSLRKSEEIFYFLNQVYRFKERMKVQELELRTMRNLDTVDSLEFGLDSLIVNFYSHERTLLKKTVTRYNSPHKKYNDSTVFFYNQNGLLEYSEMWHIYPKFKVTQMGDSTAERIRITCRRYEYDSQMKLIRYIASFPTPITMETIYTYDLSGKLSKNIRQIRRTEFWEDGK